MRDNQRTRQPRPPRQQNQFSLPMPLLPHMHTSRAGNFLCVQRTHTHLLILFVWFSWRAGKDSCWCCRLIIIYLQCHNTPNGINENKQLPALILKIRVRCHAAAAASSYSSNYFIFICPCVRVFGIQVFNNAVISLGHVVNRHLRVRHADALLISTAWDFLSTGIYIRLESETFGFDR